MDNVEVIASLYDGFDRGDIAAVLGLMDPNIHWHEAEGNPYMPSGDAWVGPDAVVSNLFAKLGADWDGFTVHRIGFHDAGSVVVVEARYTGKFKPTGKSVDAQVCHVWTLEGGTITKFQQYTDTAQFQNVMDV